MVNFAAQPRDHLPPLRRAAHARLPALLLVAAAGLAVNYAVYSACVVLAPRFGVARDAGDPAAVRRRRQRRGDDPDFRRLPLFRFSPLRTGNPLPKAVSERAMMARNPRLRNRHDTSPYDRDLDRNPANFQPLTPLTFLERAAEVFPDQLAIVHGPLRRNYREFYARAKKLASALAKRGFARGDTVAVMLANTPAMLECHYGVPMCGAVLNTLNTRLDAAAIAFMLDHGEAKALIVDREFSGVMTEALKLAKVRPLIIDYDDPEYDGPGGRSARSTTRRFVGEGDEAYECVGAARRMGRDFAQLHLGHDRRSQGRRLSSPRRQPARGRQRRHRRHGPPSGLSLDAADVPLQRLVLPVVDQRQGGRACLPAPGARQGDVRSDRRAQRDPSLRRADRHVGSAQRAAPRRSGRCRMSCASSPPPRRRPPPCWRR